MASALTKDAPSLAIPFGLFELDATGTVVRFSPPAEQNIKELQQSIIGRNFFTEIAPIKQVKDFQARFYSFTAYGESVHKFTSRFSTEEGQIKVQILLARITEQSESGHERLALVRIMPE